MVHLTMTTDVSTIRVYDDPDGYAMRQPYRVVVTVTHLNDGRVYLHGAHGDVDRETWTKILELLRERGATTVEMERHGRIKTILL